jgi:hypothetical protein
LRTACPGSGLDLTELSPDRGENARLRDGVRILVNLSMSGAQTRGAIQAARDQPLIFKIGWPPDREACAAIARVRWVSLESEEAQRETIYRIGLAFETWDVHRLKEIIRHCERTSASRVDVIGPW